MRHLIIIVALLSVVNVVSGQIYIKPKYAKRGNPHIQLEKITITDNYTIVEITHTNPTNMEVGQTFMQVHLSEQIKEKVQIVESQRNSNFTIST